MGRAKTIAAVAGLAAVPAAGLIAPAAASAKKKASEVTIVGAGSSAAQPYALALFAAYHKLHPNVRFSYNPDGGNAGVTDVQSGRAQFAFQTAAPTASNSGTTFDELFLDALCIDVNNANPVKNLSLDQVSDMFLGVDTNWSQVGGSSATIDPNGRPTSAGLYTIFKTAVLNGKNQASNVNVEFSDGLVANAIAKDPNAVGYVGLSHSTTKGQRPVSINGISCTAPNVRSENYPLAHWDYAVLPQSNPNPNVVKFVKWIQTDKAAGKVAQAAGAVWKKVTPAA